MRDITRGCSITGITGANGAGKTLLAVSCAIERMLTGRVVYSTVDICYVHPRTKVEYRSVPITSLSQLLELRDCTVLLDEVSVIFSSRGTQSLPGEVETLLHTLRHRGVDVIWTAPAWSRADINLRIVTQAMVTIAPLLKVQNGTPWPRPRVMLVALKDCTAVKLDADPERIMRRQIAVPTSLRGFGAYDTLADTPPLAAHRHSTICVECGGSMSRPKHDRERHEKLGLPWSEVDTSDRALAEAIAARHAASTAAPNLETATVGIRSIVDDLQRREAVRTPNGSVDGLSGDKSQLLEEAGAGAGLSESSNQHTAH